MKVSLSEPQASFEAFPFLTCTVGSRRPVAVGKMFSLLTFFGEERK